MAQATYTGWSCLAGPAELVDFLVDSDWATEINYAEFVLSVDVSTSPLEETQFEILATDWAATWLKTMLPSGCDVWVMQHSGIEYLFTTGGDFDHELESQLAAQWEDEL